MGSALHQYVAWLDVVVAHRHLSGRIKALA
jgi:hypothetical protein